MFFLGCLTIFQILCFLTAANAAAGTQSFNQGGGFGGFPGGGFSGSASNAAASSQTFNQVKLKKYETLNILTKMQSCVFREVVSAHTAEAAVCPVQLLTVRFNSLLYSIFLSNIFETKNSCCFHPELQPGRFRRWWPFRISC